MITLGLIVALLGVMLLAVEAHVPATGVAGAGGVVALIGGAVLLISAAGAGLAVVLTVAVIGTTLAAGSILLVSRHVRTAGRLRIRGGGPGLIGRLGIVRSWAGKSGRISLDGALWQAHDDYVEAHEQLHTGDRVVVDQVTGLTLRVRKAEAWEVIS